MYGAPFSSGNVRSSNEISRTFPSPTAGAFAATTGVSGGAGAAPPPRPAGVSPGASCATAAKPPVPPGATRDSAGPQAPAKQSISSTTAHGQPVGRSAHTGILQVVKNAPVDIDGPCWPD